jgi:hypothetical protein
MIIATLLQHQWKEKIRSPFWQKSIWINIILGLACIYMIMVFASIGYFADVILKEAYKGKDIIQAFTGLLFYYFTFDLLMRFVLQGIPVISMSPYLTLPVKKKTLLHYPLIKTIPGLFNFAAILLLLPFYFKVVCQAKPFAESLSWLIALFSLVIVNNYLGFCLKKFMAKRPLLIIGILVLLAVVSYSDIKGIIPVSEWFSTVFNTIVANPLFVAFPVLLAGLSYFLAYQMLKRNSYLEEKKTETVKSASGFSFLSRFGETGSLMQTELKMIFRNKRPKSMIWVSALFLFYGFIFYTPENFDNNFILMFAGFFVTVSAAMFYAQFYFAWESSFIDAYLANKISVTNYIKSKYGLYVILGTISFVLSLPYGFFGHKILLINIVMFVYNIGVSSFLFILFGTFNRSRIDLGKSQFMNWEGSSAAQFISMIPIMGFPLLVLGICSILGNPKFSYYILLALGLLGIIFNKYLISLVTRLFIKNKYKLAVAFRKK